MENNATSPPIALRVEPVSDITGNAKLSAITDGLDTLNRMAVGQDVTGRLRAFEARYNEFINSALPLSKKAVELSRIGSTRRELATRWQLGGIVNRFLKSIEREYQFSNYRKSISRDIVLHNREKELDALMALNTAYSSPEQIDDRLDWALILSAFKVLFPVRLQESELIDSNSLLSEILTIARGQARLAMTGNRFGAGTVARQLIEVMRRHGLI